MICRRLLVGLGYLALAQAMARAVILLGTGDPSANTSAPTGALANSGWQFEGRFSAFLGTPVATNYFLTAKHIGGNVGDTFVYNGVSFTTTAVFPDPATDLQVWRVSGSFASFAPIYSAAAQTEIGLSAVVFGRGTQRGNPVTVGSDAHLGGWLWGAGDGVQRWGTNVVQSIENASGYGLLLRLPFDANGGPNEAHLSGGDSGGALFIFNSTANEWQLAGINLGVDGPFSTSSSGANSFNAALFDTTGLYVGATPAPNPSAFYCTEIAPRRAFVEAVVMQLLSVVSRKVHGAAGPFDVDLGVNGNGQVECRSGGTSNDYTLIFHFANSVSLLNARVSAGTGQVRDFAAAGTDVTVNLTGIANAQTITVTLEHVSDGTNASNVEASMTVLVGDTNNDGAVNSADISQVKSQSGQALTANNFREDVIADGAINSADISAAKSQSGTGIATAASAETSFSAPTVEVLPLTMPRRHRGNAAKP